MNPTYALIFSFAMFVLLGFILRRAAQKGQAKAINLAERDERMRRVERRAVVFAGIGAAIGLYGAFTDNRGVLATGFAFAIVQASLPLISRFARR